jgi:hypothetical protein
VWDGMRVRMLSRKPRVLRPFGYETDKPLQEP